MPTKKYRVDTDKGSYEVEVEEPLAMGVLEQGRRSAAGEGPVTGNESKEPGTFMGGFLQSLKNQVMTPDLKKTMESASSNPMTGLLAPVDTTRSVAAGILSRIPNVLKTTAAETKGVSGAASFPFRAIRNFDETLPSTMAKRVSQFRGSSTPRPSVPRQPTPTPRPSPPTSLDPSFVSGLPEDLQKVLAEGRSTLPPEMRAPGEGVAPSAGAGPADAEEALHNSFMERMGMGQPNPSTETLGPGPHPEMAAERAAGQEPGAGGAQATDSNPAVGSNPAGPSTDQPSAAMSEPKQIDESSPWLGDENWSSGAESGSPEALRARALHSYAGEMNQVPRVFQAPGIGDLLARILAEGRGK